MKCQHCGSTDIVAIQGRNYCLNCGHVVTAQAAVASAKPNETTPVATKIAKKASSKAKVKAANAAKKPVVAKVVVAEKAVKSAKPSSPKPQRQAHPLAFSAKVSGVIGLVTGLSVWSALWFHLDNDAALFLTAAAILGAISLAVLAGAALIYGLSRQEDGRPAPQGVWWLAARGGFMDLINLSLFSLLSLIICVAVATAGSYAIVHYLQPLVFKAVVLAAINLVALWALIGVYLARRLGVPSVVIGGVAAGRGYLVGWKLYLKAGGHLLGTALEITLVRLGILLAASLLILFGQPFFATFTRFGAAVVAGAIAGVAMALISFLSLEVENRLWLRQYRNRIGLLGQKQRIALLTGRVKSTFTP